MAKDRLTLDDFLTQLRSVRKMGPQRPCWHGAGVGRFEGNSDTFR